MNELRNDALKEIFKRLTVNKLTYKVSGLVHNWIKNKRIKQNIQE